MLGQSLIRADAPPAERQREESRDDDEEDCPPRNRAGADRITIRAPCLRLMVDETFAGLRVGVLAPLASIRQAARAARGETTAVVHPRAVHAGVTLSDGAMAGGCAVRIALIFKTCGARRLACSHRDTVD